MKIGVSGDWHIDNLNGTYLIGDKNNREIDIEKQVKHMAKICKEEGVDIFVINGDLFKSYIASGYYIAFAIYLIEQFTMIGIKVIIIPGNHDINENSRGLFPAFEKLRINNVEIIEEACVIDNIFYVPHERKEKFKNYKSYTDYLLDIKKDKNVDVMIGHFQPVKAIPGSEESMFSGSTRFVDTTKFKGFPVLTNHVHKPQIIDDDVYLVGSPVKFDISERTETKQFVIYDSGSDNVAMYPLNCQKMSKITINLVKKDTYELNVEKIKKYKDQMVYINIETLKENKKTISQNEIINAFENVGAHVIRFKINTISFEEKKEEKEKENRNSMSPESVFKRIVHKEVEDKDINNILKIGMSVFDALKEEDTK